MALTGNVVRIAVDDSNNELGAFLKDRRARLDPAAFGIAPGRRRTPGLRREEVAQRANVSVTWYTWLEQGRGGAPSAEVLDRLADALQMTRAEREHLFLLAQHRPPEVAYEPPAPITPQLQRVLDSLEYSPTLVRTALGDVVAWNAAATAVFTDYAKLPPAYRNTLRVLFMVPAVRENTLDWEVHARSSVAEFRLAAARAGASAQVAALVAELRAASSDFAAIWDDLDVRGHTEGLKRFVDPRVGLIALEYASFAVDGRPDLSMVIFTPATSEDRAKVQRLMSAS